MCQSQQETRLRRLVQRTLFSGVALSGALLLLGLLLVFMRQEPRPEGPPPHLVASLRGALRGNGLSITDLAILVLMVTPLVRVAVLAAGWTLAGRRRFAAVGLVVLSLLGLSLMLGVG
jgi:uncharacterized membrane protein